MSYQPCIVLCGSVLLAMAGSVRLCAAQVDAATYNALLDRAVERLHAGQAQEAEQVARQLLALNRRYFPEKNVHWILGLALMEQGKYAEAEPELKASAEHWKRYQGTNNVQYGEALGNLGQLYMYQGRFEEAQTLMEQSIEITARIRGADSPSTLFAQANLALLLVQKGELKRAADLYWQILEPLQKSPQIGAGQAIIPMVNLGLIYNLLGRYEKTEELSRYGIALARSRDLNMGHPSVIELVRNLAVSYSCQSRFDEALPLFRWATATAEKTLGPEHPQLVAIHGDFVICLNGIGRFQEALEHLQRATAISEKLLGPEHYKVATQYFNLGHSYLRLGRLKEAEQACSKGLAITEKSLGPHNRLTAEMKVVMAEVCIRLDRDDEAQRLLNESQPYLEATDGGEHKRHNHLTAQALLYWKQGKQAEAVAAQRRALELAEATRLHTGGAELERATSFAQYAETFEQLVCWQAELGDVQGAFETIERTRARTFLEALSMPGVDLLARRTPQERQQLQQRESELHGRIAKLESELDRLPEPAENEAAAIRAKRAELLRALAEARDALYQHYRDLRGSSPVYRELISVQTQVPSLADVQKRLVGENGVLLSYFVGSEHSFLLVVQPSAARLLPLTVPTEVADKLSLKAGPLTRDVLQQLLVREDGTGVLQQISRPGPVEDALPKLAALWQVLIPDDVRDELVTRKIQRLTVLPDGPLALLPLEALVVHQQPSTEYLLDTGTAIAYGPSAAVLLNLAERKVRPPVAGTEPVLTVGDPAYPQQTPRAAPPRQGDLLAQAAGRSRYSALRARLSRLPYSGLESQWVAKVFQDAGLPAVQLMAAQATEGNVRARIAERRYVHLACHGMSSSAYGNFFGALAFAPGPKTGNPADDGLLTLAEIYDLDLKGCELALLSACETNYGPQQQGEGVWALSRGFLVAGARRVVASNWVVDDKAGASLISYTCSGIAQSEKRGQPADYAAALHAAKRWVRQQDQWSSPFYWASLVFVGPN